VFEDLVPAILDKLKEDDVDLFYIVPA